MNETANKSCLILELINDVPEFLSCFLDDEVLSLEKTREIFEYIYRNNMYDLLLLMLCVMETQRYAFAILRELREKALIHYTEYFGEKNVADFIMSELQKLDVTSW